MKRIDTFIDMHQWNLGVCWYRYGGGFFIFVSPYGNYVQEISDQANMPGDIQSTSFFFYVQDEGSWLPIVYAESIGEGLTLLEKKLERAVTNEWLEKVKIAYDMVIEINSNCYGLEAAIQAQRKELFE